MTKDLNLHIDGLRSIFKKRFSGQFTFFDGSKSIDILKGKEDVDKNFDWNVCEQDLDLFSEEIFTYVSEKKIGEKDLIKLIEQFQKSDLEIDKKIGWEIEKLYDDGSLTGSDSLIL